jgi:dipeptidyl aminopeptidase/acylaminoacyl peptidase
MPETSFLQQLLTLPGVTYALLSPDRRWVAFMWQRIHENLDVFVAPCDGSSPPVTLTHTPEATELESWSADSQAVIVSEDHNRDERSRLFRVDLQGDPDGKLQPGPMLPLTEDRPPYFIRGGVLSPDGSLLYYGANYDFQAKASIEPTWIYRHDLRSGERTPIARQARPAYTTLSLNQTGTHLIYLCKDRHPAGRQVHLVDVQGKEDREILNFGHQVKVFARWLPDSQHLLVLSEASERTTSQKQPHNSLGIYHWPSGKMRWLVDDAERSIESAWAAPDGTIIIDEIRNAGHAPSFIDPPPGGWSVDDSADLEEHPFPKIAGNLLPLGRATDGVWIAMSYSSRSPNQLMRIEFAKDTRPDWQTVTPVWEHSSLKPTDLAQAEPFNWSAPDGLPIQGWLYRARPRMRRAVIYIHGGPSSHSEDKLNAEIQYLVRRGFNVLDVNYRGSTGYGLRFREAIKEDGWGGREQSDIAAGALALIQSGLAETGKVGVTGTSFGGYCAWHMITHYPPETIGAAAPICGMTDLVVDYQTTRPDLRPLSEEMLGGNPEQAPQRYYERSPINFVQDIRGKLLIVQGACDPNVTPENVRQVVQRLGDYHIPYELLVFEDEGHGIQKPTNQATLYTRLGDFFEKALA